MVPIRHNAAEQRTVFSTRSDGQSADFSGAGLFFEPVLGFPGVQPPERSGTADFDRVAINPEANRAGRPAPYDDALNPVRTQTGAEMATDV